MSKLYKFDTFKYVDILQKELSYFIELAEALNISKASEKLGIQQSGLSRALQRLESDLGQKLFQRKSNGIALTQAGEQLYLAIKNTKKSWEENYKKAITNFETPSGLIKIGFHPSFGQKYFPTILNQINEAFPEVEVEVHTMSSSSITRKVNEQEIDFGLVISDINHPQLIRKKIGVDFIAAYQLDLSKSPQMLLFNPEMKLSAKFIRKHSNLKKIFIKDYEIMAQACVEGNYLGILPYSVAEKFPALKQVGEVYLKSDIVCITHIEQLASRAHRLTYKTILNACTGK
jgi:DNA-binding transcriptional LysR family regulator